MQRAFDAAGGARGGGGPVQHGGASQGGWCWGEDGAVVTARWLHWAGHRHPIAIGNNHGPPPDRSNAAAAATATAILILIIVIIVAAIAEAYFPPAAAGPAAPAH